MRVCDEKNGDLPCAALATKGSKCAIHGAGYAQANGAGLRCSNCRRLFPAGEWYQQRDGGNYHVKACTTHPEVIEQREREAGGKPAPVRARGGR